jgi:hypothetical protein
VSRRSVRLVAVGLCVLASSCAPRLVTLPSGPGTPLADAPAAYAQATARCRDARTLAAILGISGRAAGQRFRASLDGGFAAPANVRLELPAPGRPIFIFVASGDRATLLLGREGRVLREAPADATLEALAGIALNPSELRTIISGCGLGPGEPAEARAFDGGWASMQVSGATTWLQRVNGTWTLVAASRGPVEVRYSDFVQGLPSVIRLQSSAGQTGKATDLTVRLSQVDVNQPLGPDVFQVDIPPDAKPLTLDELRQAGPLGR